jgi:peptide/nickel transport system substrate-binding protein
MHVHQFGPGRLAGFLAPAVLLGGLAGSSASLAAERLIVALDPPTMETNRFWGTDGATGLLPSHEMLVGNDPLTGAYDNSALAESWEANDDFTEWTFHLKPDAQFHFDWGPVTAEDVAHSYELHAQDASTLTGVAQLRGAELEIVDDHTIKFIFEEPRQAFLFTVASRGSMVVYSKAQFDAEGLEGYDSKPAGTGHYQFVERTPGAGIRYERVDDHWSGQGAKFAELEFRWASEPATKLAMLLAGEAHVTDLPRELMDDALAGGKQIIASQGPAVQVAVMLHGLYQTSGDAAHRPDLPWADIRIREAMNRAVNRDEMLDVLYDNRADRMVRYGMHEPHEGFNAELVERFDEMYGYDPERARALVAEAGYPDAFPEPMIPLIATVLSGNPEFGTMIELVQVYFEEIGLQTEIREMDWASLGALGRGRQAYVVSPIRNAPIRPTEVHLINASTPGGSPYHGYEDDTIVGMIETLQKTFDPEERGRIAARRSDTCSISTRTSRSPRSGSKWRSIRRSWPTGPSRASPRPASVTGT